MVSSSSRHLTATAVVIDPDARMVLLVKHLASGAVQYPGGHVETDEATHEAAVRELFEETGVRGEVVSQRAKVLQIPGAVVHPQPLLVQERLAPAKPARGEPPHSHIDFVYLVVADASAPLTPQPEEIDGAMWVPISALHTVPGLRDDVITETRYGLDVFSIPSLR